MQNNIAIQLFEETKALNHRLLTAKTESHAYLNEISDLRRDNETLTESRQKSALYVADQKVEEDRLLSVVKQQADRITLGKAENKMLIDKTHKMNKSNLSFENDIGNQKGVITDLKQKVEELGAGNIGHKKAVAKLERIMSNINLIINVAESKEPMKIDNFLEDLLTIINE